MELRPPSNPLVLSGFLVDGVGDGQRFMALDWVRRRFRDLLQIDPFPGTVNVRLVAEDQRAALARLRASPGILIPPEAGFCAAMCHRARLVGPTGGPGIAAAVVLPDVAAYPADQVELVAAVHIRTALGLMTGDPVTIHITR